MDTEILERIRRIAAGSEPKCVLWDSDEGEVAIELLWAKMRLALFIEEDESTFYIIARGTNGFTVSGNLDIGHSWRHDE